MKEYIRAFIEATDDGTLSDEQFEEFVNDSLYEKFGDISELVSEVMEERKMKSIKIIATRDTEGFFSPGEVIKEINVKNVTKIEADSKNITIYFKNGLHEVYHADKVKLEVLR